MGHEAQSLGVLSSSSLLPSAKSLGKGQQDSRLPNKLGEINLNLL